MTLSMWNFLQISLLIPLWVTLKGILWPHSDALYFTNPNSSLFLLKPLNTSVKSWKKVLKTFQIF